MSKALLLINIGTPAAPTKREVRKFLFRFLNDKHVIDIPWLFRTLLVNLIIVPFRAGKSTKLYKELWMEEGSPIQIYSDGLLRKLQQKFIGKHKAYFAMRYSQPNIKMTLKQMQADGISQVVVLPMFPQYATSTTQSIFDEINRQKKKLNYLPELTFVEQFYNHPAYIEAVAAQVKRFNVADYDHIIFSYHGVPLRQIDKHHLKTDGGICNCKNEIPDADSKCYKASCYGTTLLLAERLGLDETKYSIAYQSRLSKKWLSPFTDEVLRDLISQRKKSVLVVAPSFVTDCLETIVEIESEYREMFLGLGGEKLDLVPSLNDSDEWVNAIVELSVV